MHEIDLSADMEASYGISLDGISPPPSIAEVSALMEAIDETGLLDQWADSLDDDELAELEREGRAIVGTEQFSNGPDYDGLDRAFALSQDLSHARQAEDREDAERRRGPRHRRPSDEILLSNGLARVARGSYIPGQLPPGIDLATDYGRADDLGRLPADDPLDIGPGFPVAMVVSEMMRQLGTDQAPRTPNYGLPPVGDLAARLGLK